MKKAKIIYRRTVSIKRMQLSFTDAMFIFPVQIKPEEALENNYEYDVS